MKHTIQHLANVLMVKEPKGSFFIFEDESLYHGSGNPVQKVNISLNKFCNEADRIAFAGWLVDRPISSTKELTVGEALAIAKSEDLLSELYEQFVLDQTW